MNEWVSNAVREWVRACVKKSDWLRVRWMSEWVSEGVREGVREWVREWVSEVYLTHSWWYFIRYNSLRPELLTLAYSISLFSSRLVYERHISLSQRDISFVFYTISHYDKTNRTNKQESNLIMQICLQKNTLVDFSFFCSNIYRPCWKNPYKNIFLLLFTLLIWSIIVSW